jgi:Putative adhesin
MKKIALAFVLVITCVASRAQHNDPDYFYTTKAFKDASPKTINANTSHGDISVSDVPASQTRVEVYIRSSNYMKKLSKEEIQRKLDEYYSLDVSISGDALKASARRKKDFIINNESGLNISFVIYVPKTAASTLETDHGNIALTGLVGNQDVETDHGDLSISKITGKVIGKTDHGNVSVTDCNNDIDANTDHGDITAMNCEGTIKLNTSHGNIDLKDLKGKVRAGTDHGDVSGNTIAGELTASTSHGNVTLERMSSIVNASTDHGDISLSAVSITGDIVVKNDNGNVTLDLPKGKGLNLDLQGKYVSTDGMQNFNGSKSKDLVNGSVNGGGVKVIIRTNHDARLSFK